MGEFAATYTELKSEIVADQGTRPGLTPDCFALDNDRSKPLRGCVDRCCKARRSGTHNHNVIASARRRDLNPMRNGKLCIARIVQDRTVVPHGSG